MPILEINNREQPAVASDLFPLIFRLGSAAAHESHLPMLPLVLAQMLAASRVQVRIEQGSRTLLDFAYPPESRIDGPALSSKIVHKHLGPDHLLQIRLDLPEEMTPRKTSVLDMALSLIVPALCCIVVQQHDRESLGEPFDRLSDREWRICLALEQPDGEKQIATTLPCLRDTMHSYVKSMYRKLGVQSRLQMLAHLKAARERLRRRSLEMPATSDAILPEPESPPLGWAVPTVE